MKKIICLLGSTLFLLGCATAVSKKITPTPSAPISSGSTEEKEVVDQTPVQTSSPTDQSFELKSLQGDALVGYEHKKGVVFAKVEVDGLLKTDFLNLMIEDIHDPEHRFQLFIGDNVGSKSFPWEGEQKNIGYFFIELPKGSYIMDSVGIPVGSTMAMESMNVTFNVIPGHIAYLGTLKLVGTKEKVRLGGVPVIKPGFEYELEILNEKDEVIDVFHKRYPKFKAEVVESLMVVSE